MIVVELTAAIDAAGTTQTFYLADGQFVTGVADTPANTHFEPALNDPGYIGLSVFSDGTTGGGTQLEMGEIVIANTGQYDGWIDYGFDGRPAIIRRGQAGMPYPASFATLFTGTIDAVSVLGDEISVRLRDLQIVFDTPVNVNVYAGTNSAPNGYEGLPTTIKGKRKGRVFGNVPNMTPTAVNPSKLAYQVNDGPVLDIAAVYDRAASLTKGANHANRTLLEAATVTAGTYQTCFAEGYFRLGANPSGTVTADVIEGATAADRTTAQVLKKLAVIAGVDGTTGIVAGDVTALDTAQGNEIGIQIEDEETVKEAMDKLSQGIGGYYFISPQGQLRMGLLTVPSGSPDLVLSEYDMISPERKEFKDRNIPVFAVRLKHSKIWTVQTSDIATGVSADRKAVIGQEWRTVTAQDLTVIVKFLLSEPMEVESYFVIESPANTEAARQLAIQKVRRDMFELSIPVELAVSSSIWLMSVVSLVYSRYGLAGGRLFRVIGFRYELKTDKVFLTLWG